VGAASSRDKCALDDAISRHDAAPTSIFQVISFESGKQNKSVLMHCTPPIHKQGLPGDEITFGRGQEKSGTRQVLWFFESTKWCSGRIVFT
jgi:hypothetical protein